MRILIVSAFYPPLNNIASQRIHAMEKYLKQLGNQVDVITRFYDESIVDGKSMFVYEKSPVNMQQPYIKKDNVIYTNYDEHTTKRKIFNSLPPLVKGVYSYLSIDVYSYGWLKYVDFAFEKELSGNKYDVVIASYGPPIAILAARNLSNKYNIPLVVDFRDIFINEKDKGYHLFMKKWQQRFLLKKAKGLVFVSQGMSDFFKLHCGKKLAQIPQVLVMNGVDTANDISAQQLDNVVLSQFNAIQSRYAFVLLHTGTVYAGQQIEFFTNAIVMYNDQNPQRKGAIVFIGADNRLRDLNALKNNSIYFIDKTNLTTSLYLQKQSNALLVPVWQNRYTGFSGKLFEYLASGNNVFIGPGMQHDVVDFVKDFKQVVLFNTTDSFLHHLSTSSLNPPTTQSGNTFSPVLERKYWINKLNAFLKQLQK